jgi:hypothetical protein
MNILKNAIKKIKNLGGRELTPKESIEMLKNLLKKYKGWYLEMCNVN